MNFFSIFARQGECAADMNVILNTNWKIASLIFIDSLRICVIYTLDTHNVRLVYFN